MRRIHRYLSALFIGSLFGAAALAQSPSAQSEIADHRDIQIDPQAQALLKKLDASGAIGKIITPKDVVEARNAYTAVSALAGPPEPVFRVTERQIPGPAGPISIRVYKPRESDGLPVLVYFHGGIFTTGSLDTHDSMLRTLANRSGYVAVSVDYRLAPEHPFPAAPEDAYAATAWVAAHAAEIGGDSRQVAVGGDGAGGNLAAAVTLMARDRGGPPLLFQVLIYPFTSAAMMTLSWWDYADGPVLNREGMLYHLARYTTASSDIRNPYLSPLAAQNFRGLPSALVITAEHDPARDEAEQYAHQLRDDGVKVTLTRYEGMVHGFVQLGTALDAGSRCLNEIAQSLKEAASEKSRATVTDGGGN